MKSLKTKNDYLDGSSTIVIGGAGSGKSTVINVLKQWFHIILRKEGDNSDHPYVVVVAPTDTAASNVRGQTLHCILLSVSILATSTVLYLIRKGSNSKFDEKSQSYYCR